MPFHHIQPIVNIYKPRLLLHNAPSLVRFFFRYLAFEGQKIIRTARRSILRPVAVAWMRMIPAILLGIACGSLLAPEFNMNIYLATPISEHEHEHLESCRYFLAIRLYC